MRRRIGGSLAADERLVDPFSEKFPVYVLLELSCGAGIDLRALLEGALVSVGKTLLDAVIPSSQEQAARLWRLRETMVEIQGGGEAYLRSDVSLPISQIPAFVAAVETALAQAFPQTGINIYGHIGAGSLHINIIPRMAWSAKRARRCSMRQRQHCSAFLTSSAAASARNTGSAGQSGRRSWNVLTTCRLTSCRG
jgi:FAD/FMN-containing dehydrogenase